MAAIVGIISRHGFAIEVECWIESNLNNKSVLVLYKPRIHFNNH